MKKRIALILVLLLTAGCIQVKPAVTEAPATEAPASTEPTAAPTEAPTAEPAVTAAVEAPVEYAFTFTAKTLDGEKVTEEVFGQYDLTMVNIWASWCGPCRGEMGELAALYGKLPENVNFLSVTVDEAGDLKDAADILKENGCTFPCLDGLASAGLVNGFINKVMAIPTTIFFDRSGNQVGQWIVGVPQGSGSVADAYLGEIQTRLNSLTGK